MRVLNPVLAAISALLAGSHVVQAISLDLSSTGIFLTRWVWS